MAKMVHVWAAQTVEWKAVQMALQMAAWRMGKREIQDSMVMRAGQGQARGEMVPWLGQVLELRLETGWAGLWGDAWAMP